MHNIVIDGVTYTSAKQACVAIGLPYKTFLSRRREGKDVMDSLSLDKKKRTTDHPNHPSPVVLQGKKYRSVSEACRAHNISYVTVRCRMRHKHMSLEEAILAPKKDITKRSNI